MVVLQLLEYLRLFCIFHFDIRVTRMVIVVVVRCIQFRRRDSRDRLRGCAGVVSHGKCCSWRRRRPLVFVLDSILIDCSYRKLPVSHSWPRTYRLPRDCAAASANAIAASLELRSLCGLHLLMWLAYPDWRLRCISCSRAGVLVQVIEGLIRWCLWSSMRRRRSRMLHFDRACVVEIYYRSS